MLLPVDKRQYALLVCKSGAQVRKIGTQCRPGGIKSLADAYDVTARSVIFLHPRNNKIYLF